MFCVRVLSRRISYDITTFSESEKLAFSMKVSSCVGVVCVLNGEQFCICFPFL